MGRYCRTFHLYSAFSHGVHYTALRTKRGPGSGARPARTASPGPLPQDTSAPARRGRAILATRAGVTAMGLWDRLFGSSQARFARQMIAALRRAGFSGPMKYEAAAFRLVGTGESVFQIHLGNLYDEYLATPPAERPQAVEHFAQALVADQSFDWPQSFEEALPNLRPWVRERFYVESLRLHSRLGEFDFTDLPHRVLAEHLAVLLAYDRPGSVAGVPAPQLEAWGVSFDEAVEAGADRLRETTPVEGFELMAPGVYVSTWHDCYDASRMYLTDVMRALDVQGDPVAIPANRNLLLVCGSDDPRGLATMARLADDALKKPRPLSGVAARLLEDEWVHFMPDPDHPAWGGLRRLLTGSHGRDYAEQKEILDALHEQTGEDVFVASYSMVGQEKTGELLFTYCVWSETVDTLLPKAERVVLNAWKNNQARCLGYADWGRVTAVCGDLMEPMGLYPERYRVREFPTPEQIEALELKGMDD